MLPRLEFVAAACRQRVACESAKRDWNDSPRCVLRIRSAVFFFLDMAFRLPVIITPLLAVLASPICAETAPLTDADNNDAEKTKKAETKAEPRRSPEQEARLAVRRLGDPNWRTREQAEQTLEELGLEALPALNAALDDPDAEIHARVFALRIRFLGRGFLGISMDERGGQGNPPANDAEDADTDEAETDRIEPIRLSPPQPRPEVIVVAGAADAPDISPRWPKDKKMPAEIAGIRPGDQILSVNGFRLGGASDLIYRVVEAGPGASVLLKIKRGDEELLAAAVLTHNPLDVPKMRFTPLDFRSRPESSLELPEPPESPSNSQR